MCVRHFEVPNPFSGAFFETFSNVNTMFVLFLARGVSPFLWICPFLLSTLFFLCFLFDFSFFCCISCLLGLEGFYFYFKVFHIFKWGWMVFCDDISSFWLRETVRRRRWWHISKSIRTSYHVGCRHAFINCMTCSSPALFAGLGHAKVHLMW